MNVPSRPVPHHRNALDCPACEAKLLDAHPEIARWARFARAGNVERHISWTFRGQADQDLCVRQGKSEKPWPTSKHNTMKEGKPWARAVDFFRMTPMGQGEWKRPFFQEISDELAKANAPLIWLGRHVGWDGDHFQLEDSIA